MTRSKDPKTSGETAGQGLQTWQSPARRAWAGFCQQRLAVVSALFLLLLLLAVWLIPLLSPFGPETISEDQFQPPGARHWCGTDLHGRDLLVRLCYGARLSLLVGLVGTGVSLVIGGTWGTVAGYAGGWVDEVMMRGVDILYTLPSVIFVIVLITTLEGILLKTLAQSGAPTHQVRLLLLFAGLGAVSWLTMARIVRGQVMSLKEKGFVEAARALGLGPGAILWRHILPNILGVVLVYLTLTIPSVILYESFLSFLGLGIQPPQASWGSLIAEGAGQINPIRIYWWLLVFPGASLVLTLLALTVLGDGLREALDPKSGSRS